MVKESHGKGYSHGLRFSCSCGRDQCQRESRGVFEGGLLLLASELQAASVRLITEYNVQHILNMAGSQSCNFHGDLTKYHMIELKDEEQAQLPLYESISLINKAVVRGQPVLVHCIEGKSRSGAIVVAYYMWRNGWTYDVALSFVSEQRAVISNPGFVQQLVSCTTSHWSCLGALTP